MEASKVWSKCKCGFEIKDNDLERYDSLCPVCGLDWMMKGFDGKKVWKDSEAEMIET